MRDYLISTKVSHSSVDMSRMVPVLNARGWNVVIVIFANAYEGDAYLYKKELISTADWVMFGTRDFSINLPSLISLFISEHHEKKLANKPDRDLIYNKISELDLIEVRLQSDWGDGYAHYLYKDYSYENKKDEVEAYKQSVSQEVYEVLEAGREFYYIYHFDKDNAESAAFCKDAATAFANLLGTAIGQCNRYDSVLNSSFEVVNRQDNIKELAIESAKKLLALTQDETRTITPNGLLELIISQYPSRVYHFDMECIDGSDSYTLLLREILAIAGLDLRDISISEEYTERENECEVKIQLTIGDKKNEWMFAQGSDWVENSFLLNVAAFVRENTNGKLADLREGDQTCRMIFLEAEIADYLCIEGVLTIWDWIGSQK